MRACLGDAIWQPRISSKKQQQWVNMSYKLCSCLTTCKCAPRLVLKANVTYASQMSSSVRTRLSWSTGLTHVEDKDMEPP